MNLTYPGGQLKTVEFGATAGDQTENIGPGARKRWLVLRAWTVLSCDATVANRYIDDYLVNNGTVTAFLPESSAFAAGVTGRKMMLPGHLRDSTGLMGVSVWGAYPIFLEGDSEFWRITISNGQAGDEYSGVLIVREFGL